MPIENSGFLTPVLALVAWTMAMWLWMYATRIPAMQKAGINPQDAAHPGSVLAEKIPSNVRSIADNYNHLHEAPTVFYALMFYVAFTGGGDSLMTGLAWAYVGLRVLHSLIQATVNIVAARFAIFALSSFVIFAMVLRAGLGVL